MSEQRQRIIAPILILLILLILWEGLVTALQIEQFLLPKPTAILSNLVRVVRMDMADSTPLADREATALLRASRLLVDLPGGVSPDLWQPVEAARIFEFRQGSQRVLVIQGANLIPIVQASWFTLKEALGGLAMGGLAGVLVALATARWTATREALLPFAIAANSMPIIAFAPIFNNWFGIDNPFSKMAIVAVMVFFPLMINTVRGLVSVPPRSLELMRSYAASEFAILFKARIPNALPYLFSGLKVAGALAMIGAIVGEYFGGPRIALGVFITQEAALFRFASAWAAIFSACIMGISLYLLILLAERLAMPWHSSFRK
ncbi:MAG: ABC transporter permease subunit [Caldilineaceae bacterium]|nr:ABC transporter permease subunit [Caldilineaceae bacterium]HRJ43093.1 ABC transporter permease subunit [Caldilineaceae bacterium]